MLSSPHDHAGLEVLDLEECSRLLASTPVGRLAFVADGDVQVLPVNYRWHEGGIVFRTAQGAKLEAAARHAPVAFEIDGWDSAERLGWSVIVKGTAVEILDEAEAEHLTHLDLRPWTDRVERRRWIRIRADEITGRRID